MKMRAMNHTVVAITQFVFTSLGMFAEAKEQLGVILFIVTPVIRCVCPPHL